MCKLLRAPWGCPTYGKEVAGQRPEQFGSLGGGPDGREADTGCPTQQRLSPRCWCHWESRLDYWEHWFPWDVPGCEPGVASGRGMNWPCGGTSLLPPRKGSHAGTGAIPSADLPWSPGMSPFPTVPGLLRASRHCGAWGRAPTAALTPGHTNPEPAWLQTCPDTTNNNRANCAALPDFVWSAPRLAVTGTPTRAGICLPGRRLEHGAVSDTQGHRGSAQRRRTAPGLAAQTPSKCTEHLQRQPPKVTGWVAARQPVPNPPLPWDLPFPSPFRVKAERTAKPFAQLEILRFSWSKLCWQWVFGDSVSVTDGPGARWLLPQHRTSVLGPQSYARLHREVSFSQSGSWLW